MNVTTRYDHENQIRIHTFEGDVTAEDIKIFLQQFIDNPDSHIEYSALWDLSQANLDFKKEQFSELVRWMYGVNDKPTGGKLALVFESEFGFAIGRMYQGYTSDTLRTTNIFLDTDQAMEWLLDKDPDNPI